MLKLESKKSLRVAGLMSGTSADGVDVAVVDIRGRDVRLLAFDVFPYPAALRKEVLALCRPETARLDRICHFNHLLGEVFAEAVIRLCRDKGIALHSVDLIGSHGQTIWHSPEGGSYRGRMVRSTLQIGEPSVIAQRTGITTVADFRPRDMAAGGQGAPLVPYADYVLFSDPKVCRAVQNIGGIANMTFLPACSSMGVSPMRGVPQTHPFAFGGPSSTAVPAVSTTGILPVEKPATTKRQDGRRTPNTFSHVGDPKLPHRTDTAQGQDAPDTHGRDAHATGGQDARDTGCPHGHAANMSVLAFDTGPGNMVIDGMVRLTTGGKRHFDRDGAMAAKGRVHEKLLKEMLKHPFLRRRPPKSTGREQFGQQYCEWLYAEGRKRRLTPEDMVATATAFTAASIALAWRRFLPQIPDEMILCGGGSHNATLVRMLRAELTGVRIRSTDEFGISVDAKEAVSFAILAAATIKGVANNIPSATGADEPVVLGKIVPGR